MEHWLTSTEVARELRCKIKRVCELARTGLLPGEMVPKGPHDPGRGTRWRFSREAVEQFKECTFLEDGTRVRYCKRQQINATRDDLLWFAGWFGGEGCVCVDRNPGGSHWTLSIILPNSCHKVQNSLPGLFGGSCHLIKKSSHQNHEQVRWRASGRQAARILKAILPYLRNKRRQAELAIMLQDNIDRAYNNSFRPTSPEDRALRDAIYEQIKWLNHHPNEE